MIITSKAPCRWSVEVNIDLVVLSVLRSICFHDKVETWHCIYSSFRCRCWHGCRIRLCLINILISYCIDIIAWPGYRNIDEYMTQHARNIKRFYHMYSCSLHTYSIIWSLLYLMPDGTYYLTYVANMWRDAVYVIRCIKFSFSIKLMWVIWTHIDVSYRLMFYMRNPLGVRLISRILILNWPN